MTDRALQRANQQLVTAARRGNVDAMVRALALGADPALGLHDYGDTCLGWALAQLDPGPEKDRLAQAFLDHGVNLGEVAYFPSQTNPDTLLRRPSAWESPEVRHHPLLAAQALCDARRTWTTEQPGEPDFSRRFWEQYGVLREPEDKPWRAAFRRDIQADPARELWWWWHALKQPGPEFVRDLVEEVGALPPLRVLEALEAGDHGLALRSGNREALLAWVDALSPAERIDAFLGIPRTGRRAPSGSQVPGRGPGLLAALANPAWSGIDARALWERALQEPAVWDTMRREQTLAGYAVLLVRCWSSVEAPRIIQWLEHFQALGLDLVPVRAPAQAAIACFASVRSPFALASSPELAEASERKDEGLLETHLRQVGPDSSSVKVCQWLVKQGLVPTPHTLGLLCAKMSQGAWVRRWGPLFKTWIKTFNLNPDAGPVPAWAYLRGEQAQDLLAPLVAWHRQRALAATLPAPPQAPPVRPRF